MTTTTSNNTPDLADTDILIIGAGVSGIGAACHLSRNCADKSYQILERRERIGGTWDLFRYPGIRSDSDMASFGFNFKPWKGTNVLADGENIRNYLVETAREYQVDKKIRFGCKVTKQRWCSYNKLWTVTFEDEATGKEHKLRAKFLIACTGYYNYDRAYTPDFKDSEYFLGDIIHPQFWPENYDYSGKKVVVIGSGATAVTLVPSMADKVKQITMLQRSPSYVFSLPNHDALSEKLRGKISDTQIYKLARVKSIAGQLTTFNLSKKAPAIVKKFLQHDIKKQLGKGYDISNFTPKYQPWDQRLCVAPDGDLFKAINSGKAEVVTDEVESFTKTGIQLKSGQHLDADIIITATGLELQSGGGSTCYVDNDVVAMNEKMTYKGVLIEDVPNFAIMFGYINATWTIKIDMALEYVCRLLNYMDTKSYTEVIPKDIHGNRTNNSVSDKMKSGYIQRSNALLPRQGKDLPWKVTNNILLDMKLLKFDSINDDALQFKKS